MPRAASRYSTGLACGNMLIAYPMRNQGRLSIDLDQKVDGRREFAPIQLQVRKPPLLREASYSGRTYVRYYRTTCAGPAAPAPRCYATIKSAPWWSHGGHSILPPGTNPGFSLQPPADRGYEPRCGPCQGARLMGRLPRPWPTEQLESRPGAFNTLLVLVELDHVGLWSPKDLTRNATARRLAAGGITPLRPIQCRHACGLSVATGRAT